MENNDIVKIDADLYKDKEKSEVDDIIKDTKIIVDKIDDEFVERVVRITKTGQLDGN